ncbi:MAG: DNA polymerase III subunit gamma/tau [Leptospirillia bacterium]
MSYQVSARKYRPQRFDEVVGQPHIVRTLTNAIGSARIGHAYLFSGIRGVGKTTVARIFAKALNCESGPTAEPCNTCETCRQIVDGHAADVIEIDGASNNSVDNIRDLSENIRYRPLACRYKIYIIDEVHMLSGSAFNALLKTLEEPPGHAVFVLATTETHKLPQTIVSRCQHYAFRRVSRAEISDHLNGLAERDGISVSRSALSLVAQAADGSLRDALSLFDQAVSFGGGQIEEADISLMLGVSGQSTLSAFAGDILSGDAAGALNRLKDVINAGQDISILSGELVEQFRNLLVCKVTDTPETLIDLSSDDVAELSAQAQDAPREVLEQVLGLLTEAQERCRRAEAPRFLLEAALVRACQTPQLVDLGELLSRLDGDRPQAAARPQAAPARPAPARPAPQPPRSAPQPAPTAAPQAPPAQAPPAEVAPAAAMQAAGASTPKPPASAPEAPSAAQAAPTVPQDVAAAPVPQAAAPEPPAAPEPAPALTEPPAHRAPAARIPEPEPEPEPTPAAASKPAPESAPMFPPATVSEPAPRADPAVADARPAPFTPPPGTPTPVSGGPREIWTATVREINKRRPSLAAYLEQGVFRSASEDRLEVGFLPAYEVMYSMVSRPENQKFIANLANEVAGREVTVVLNLISDQAEDVSTLAQEFEAEAQAEHRQEVENAMELPFVKEVLDEFGGEIVELHKPDPES